ncbi:LysR family transcriptional regulator [Paremcibacter congregatus]|uniref:LysR family transcriptional regulator n=1 Tax=Paremcibacter congregatus TaxID=2043170 RepID=UPI003A8F0FE8
MINRLNLFLKVIELGSFSAVSRAAGLSPSSISRQMDKLEADFGIRLLNRSTHVIHPTEAGLALAPYAENSLAQLDQARQEICPPSEKVTGALKVSVFSTFGNLAICPLLPKFFDQFPDVSLTLNAEDCMVDLTKENVDLAVRIGRPQDSSLKMRPLMVNHMRLVASPAYIARHGLPENPENLRHHNCLTFDRNRKTTWWHFDQNSRQIKVPVSGNLRSVGGAPLYRAALAGLGITVTTRWQSHRAITRGDLLPLLPDWSASLDGQGANQIYAVYLPDRHMRPALRAFLDFLVAELAPLNC